MNRQEFRTWDTLPINRDFIDFLLEVLKDKPPETLYYNGKQVDNYHIKAVSLLSKLGEDHVEYLCSVAEETKLTNQKIALIKVLGNICTDRTIQTLLFLLNDEDTNIVHRVIYYLTSNKIEQAYPRLEELFRDPRREVRLSVLDLINLTKNKRFIPFLEGTLSESDKEITKSATFSLLNLGWKPVQNYDKIQNLLEEDQGEAILELKEDVVPALLHIVKHPGGGFIKAERAIQVLANLKDERAIDVLIERLSNDSISIAEAKEIYTALGNIGNANGFDACLNGINSRMNSEIAVKSMEKILYS